MMRPLAGVALLLMAGCSMQQPYQAQAMNNGNGGATLLAQVEACARAAYDAPDTAALRPHAPMDLRQASLAQLSDPSFPTNADIPLIKQWHDRISACRQQMMSVLAQAMPSVVPILTRALSAADDDIVLLIQKRISWGEAVRRGRDRTNTMMAEVGAEQQRLQSAVAQARVVAAQARAMAAQEQAARSAAAGDALLNASRMFSEMGRPSWLPYGASWLPHGAYRLPSNSMTCNRNGTVTTCDW